MCSLALFTSSTIILNMSIPQFKSQAKKCFQRYKYVEHKHTANTIYFNR